MEVHRDRTCFARFARKKLRKTLDKALAPQAEWDEVEQTILGLVESAADRVEVLKALLDVEVAKVPVSTRRVTELASEVRMLETSIARYVQQLVPDPAAVVPKSRQHQAAAMSRWHRGAV